MRNIIPKLFLPFLLVLLLIALTGCKEIEKEMLVSTGEVTSILTNSADASGVVVDLGEGGATQHGHCYAKTPNVSVTDSKTQLGIPAGTSGFTSQLTNLEAGTKYYIKAYITDGIKPAYGKEISFTTLEASVPVLTTTAISSITTTTSSSGGEITSNGGAPVTVRGVCWSTSNGPTTANSKTSDGTGSGSFSSSLTGLTPNTTYYVRAYATNSAGTGYGSELSFKTIVTNPPTVSTSAITGITQTTATGGGIVTSDGGASVTARGVCWNTSGSPTTADIKTTDGTGTGSYASSLTGLTGNTTYYVRAYAINNSGTSYGEELSFKTGATIPSLTTTSVTSITVTTASSGGNITSDGGSNVTVRGVCWNTATLPTTVNNKTTDGTGTGIFTSSLTGLTGNITYYVRAYATNSTGTAYGNEQTFTTSSVTVVVPTVSTTAVTAITQTTATSGGNITSDGGSTITAKGVCWSTNANPTIADPKTSDGTGTGVYTSSMSSLTGGTTYHVRAYATNSAGTGYGSDVTFTTSPLAVVPTLTTTAVYALASTTTNSGGNITSDGGAAVTARGVCWSTSSNPTTADSKTTNDSGTGAFISSLTGLISNTTYNVRAYATNSVGTAYGSQVTFTTTAQVIDYDGNTYNTVKVGTQLWTQENLKVTHYRNGDAIPEVTDGNIFIVLTNGAYCNYNNDNANVSIYGRLYNFFATVDNRNLCPTGWHVPTEPEITIFENYLIANGYNYDGTFANNKIAKALGSTTYWESSSGEGDVGNTDYPVYRNKSGFTGQPAGFRHPDGLFWYIGKGAVWWASTEISSSLAVAYSIFNMSSFEGNSRSTGDNKIDAFSVRCLQGEGKVLPAVTTTAISGIGSSVATSGGNITSDGGASVIARGVCWSTTANPTTADSKTDDGTGTGSFTSSLTGLSGGTTYHVRAYATNSVGTAYGSDVTFTTNPLTVPTLTSAAIVALASQTASSGGTITDNGGTAVTASGVCWNTSSNPTTANSKTTDGTASGTFRSDLTGLTPNTAYYLRAYATNSVETAYGNEVTFTTTIQVTDYDGNTYNTVKVGTQLWTKEHLRVVHYRTGDVIPEIEDDFAWGSAISGAHCNPNNIHAIGDSEGKLYNFYATVDNRNLCPAGWHVPTVSEWITFEDYLIGNGYNYDGTISGNKIAKSLGSKTSWDFSDAEGAVGNTDYASYRNKSGFSAIPTGLRYASGFNAYGWGAVWWTSTETNASQATAVSIWNMANSEGRGATDAKCNGFSIRCIQGEGKVLAAVTTTAVTDITSTTATGGGDVTSDGGASVTARGICLSTSHNPTVNDICYVDGGGGSGSFSGGITGLSPVTTYYIRAYATNSVGTVYGNEESFTTSAFACGSTVSVNHTAGNVSPVTKTVTYGTVSTNLSGATKCWITQNLGADNQASSATDATEAAAGCYWQFNRKQGYKHNGTTRTPNTTWITSIDENSDWTAANDPCTILLSSGWRIPTNTEWTNADNNGAWASYNDTYASVLKLHAAGSLYGNDGSLLSRGTGEAIWSSTQDGNISGWYLNADGALSYISNGGGMMKVWGFPIRCLKD